MRRVLLAEDNKINQVVPAGTLQKLGYAVDIVEDGRAAVTACLSGDFDAVLMDVMMPEMDGYEATSRIRAHEAEMGSPEVPIIGLSARAMDGDREIALEAGFTDYLTKPLRAIELEASLIRWIRSETLKV